MNNENRAPLFDLMIVLLIAFSPAIVQSVIIVTTGESLQYNATTLNLAFSAGILHQVLSILLLIYVLSKRNITIKYLGIDLNIKELLLGVGLYILAMLMISTCHAILNKLLSPEHARLFQAKNIGQFSERLSWLLVLYTLINPFFEELIVRGFAMTEIFSMTNSRVWAVVVSVVIQTSYHLYQGLYAALLLMIIFITFAVYYVRTGRLTPVIIAHLIFDLTVLLKAKHPVS